MLQKKDLKTKSKHQKKFQQVFFFFLFGGELFLFSIYFSNISSDAVGTNLFGFSRLRFIVLAALLMLAIASILTAISLLKGWKLGEYAKRITIKNSKTNLVLRYIFGILGTLSWVLYVSPYNTVNFLANFYFGMKPFFLLGSIISFQFLMMFILEKNDDYRVALWKFIQKRSNLFKIWGIVTAGSLIFWSFVSTFEVGLIPNGEDYWYEAGVPLLWYQVIGSIAIGVCFWKIEKYFLHKGKITFKVDIALFALIWIIGGFLWAKTPLPNGYFNPGPYPPTFETYPYSDAAQSDLMSQYALIGEGLNNGKPYNRPAYPAYLVYLHLISGQNFERNMQVQAALFAVFPALFFVLVRLFFNRSGGIIAGLIVIMRGLNGISSTNLLNMANQKMMFSEFPFVIALILMLILCIFWWKNPKKVYITLLIGGAFGLTLYLRQTIIGVLAIFIFLFFYNSGTNKFKINVLALFIMGSLIIISPYEIRSFLSDSDSFTPSFITKIISVRNRYFIEDNKNSINEQKDGWWADPENEDYDSKSNSGSWESDSGSEDDYLIIDSDSDTDSWRDFSEQITNSQEGGTKFQPEEKYYSNVFEIVGQHYIHNVITSFLVLPTTLSADNMAGIIKAEDSFWHIDWGGNLNFEQMLLLTINLLVVGLGISVSYKKEYLLGLIPLFAFLLYNFANSMGRTSGGRYIVPVDWIIVFYYVLGLLQLFKWTFSDELNKSSFIKEASIFIRKTGDSENVKGIFFSTIILLVFGFSLILPDYIFPKQFDDLDREQIQQELIKSNFGENDEYIKKWINYNEKRIFQGMLMYPRYFERGDGGTKSNSPYNLMDYSRLAFTLIGSSGTKGVIMAGSNPADILNRSSVFVIGCKEKNYFDAAVIIVYEPEPAVFLRDPQMEPACPLPKP